MKTPIRANLRTIKNTQNEHTETMVTHDTNLVENVVDRIFTFEVNKKNEQYTYSICLEKDEIDTTGGKR